MIIGYTLNGPDNKCHMYADAPGLQLCKKCGYKLDDDYVNPDLSIKPRCYDISSTFDNCTIVSQKFKEFCLRSGYTGIIFHELPSDRDFLFMTVSEVLEFDAEKRETRFKNFCKDCGNYEAIIGATPVFLKNITVPLQDGFYRTDLAFGTGSARDPVVIIGVETYKKMKKEKFNGPDFGAIRI
jgi:hypothetical protein